MTEKIDALADQLRASVQAFVQRSLSDSAEKQRAASDLQIDAIAKRVDADAARAVELRDNVAKIGAELGEFRKSIDALVTLSVQTVIKEMRAELIGPPGPTGENGKDGAPGRDGIDGKDGASGRDGIDGKDGAAGLPGVDGKDGAAGIDGKDGAPGDRGEPGLVGERGLPGERGVIGAKGMDGRDGREGTNGRDGADGMPGRDALEIEPLVGMDELASYQRGTWVTHRGGLFRAFRTTDAVQDGNFAAAGWQLVVCGMNDVRAELAPDARTFLLSIETTDGKAVTKSFKTPMQIYRGVYREGIHYEKGDTVTHGGSTWHANEGTSDRPGEASKAWQLMTKRGRDGKDAGENK